MNRRNSPLAEWIATGVGAGYLPVAPGTWGSIEAVAAAWAAHRWFPARERLLIAAAAALFSIMGVWAAGRTARDAKDPDPSKVVVDEIAGQLLTFLFVPLSASVLILGFLFFRVFDIIKPFPARQSEDLPGGWGIMADDLIAGVFAGVCLLLLHQWLGLI